MGAASEFLKRYSREFDYYQQLARICQQQCETGLEQNGIRAIVTSRAKRPDRLRDKIEDRERKRGREYANPDEIAEDIVDLAGVRVALYFAGESDRVEKFINTQFIVQLAKKFPSDDHVEATGVYENRFSGYHARHYRVSMKEEFLRDADNRYCLSRIEIQVASVLMHAWAEVNHDLVYKPFTGQLSEVELATLDQLNGLVLVGEIALRAVQQGVEGRVKQGEKPFLSHFDLAAYLHRLAKEASNDKTEEPAMGRVDYLFELLQRADLNSTAKLNQAIQGVSFEQGSQPLAERVIDAVLVAKPELSDLFVKVKRDVGERNPYGIREETGASPHEAALGRFMKRWGELEGTLHKIVKRFEKDVGPRWSYGEMRRIIKDKKILSDVQLREFESVLRCRNEVIHSDAVVPEERLVEAANVVDELLTVLQNQA